MGGLFRTTRFGSEVSGSILGLAENLSLGTSPERSVGPGPKLSLYWKTLHIEENAPPGTLSPDGASAL